MSVALSRRSDRWREPRRRGGLGESAMGILRPTPRAALRRRRRPWTYSETGRERRAGADRHWQGYVGPRVRAAHVGRAQYACA